MHATEAIRQRSHHPLPDRSNCGVNERTYGVNNLLTMPVISAMTGPIFHAPET